MGGRPVSELGKGVVAWDVDGERVEVFVDASMLTMEQLQNGIDHRTGKFGSAPILIDIPGFEHNIERTINLSQRVPGVGFASGIRDEPIPMKEREFLQKSSTAYGILGGIAGGAARGLASIPAVALGVPGMQKVAEQHQREAGATPRKRTGTEMAKMGAIEGGVQAASMGVPAVLKTMFGRGVMATGQATVPEARALREAYAAAGIESPLPSGVAQSKGLEGLQVLFRKSMWSGNQIDQWAAKTEMQILEKAAEEFAGPAEDVVGNMLRRGSRSRFAQFKAQAKKYYNEVDALITSRTDDLIIPLKGAEDLADTFDDAAKLLNTIGGARERRIINALKKAAKKGQAIPYETARTARSMLGRLASSPSVAQDIRGKALREVRDFLTMQIEGRVKGLGDDVLDALHRADGFYREGIRKTDDFWKVIDKKTTGAEITKLMESWVKGKDVARIDEVMGALKPDEVLAVQNLFMRRHILTESETAFRGMDAIVDNYEKMTKPVKDSLFGVDTPLRKSWENFHDVAKNSKRFSMRLTDVEPGSNIGIMMMDVGAPAAALTGAGAAAVSNPFSALLVAGLYPLGVNRGAHLFTSPKFLDWMTEFAELKPNGIGPHLGRLLSIYTMEENPEVKDAIIGFIGNIRESMEQNRVQNITGLLAGTGMPGGGR